MKRLGSCLLFLVLSGATWPGEDPSDVGTGAWEVDERGLSFLDVETGSGASVSDRAGVEVHYVGMLEDGTVFDASRPRGAPFTFRVGAGEVIQGWDQGLLGMKVGGVRRLIVPPELGYGDRDTGPIPPNSTLYFEIELLGVEPPRRPPKLVEPPASLWEARGEVHWVDLALGDGPKLKVKVGRRACVDYAAFDPEGELGEHTWLRKGCTWFALGEGDLPAPMEQGMRGMRAGGKRLVRAGDTTWEVVVEALGK